MWAPVRKRGLPPAVLRVSHLGTEAPRANAPREASARLSDKGAIPPVIDRNRKVLLLSNCRPGPGGVGELFLSTLAGSLTPGSLVSYSTASPTTGAVQGWSQWSGHWAYCHPVPLAGRPIASTVTHWATRLRSLGVMTAEVKSIVRDHRVSLLWAVMDAPHVVDLALQVAGATGVPLAVLVWDIPQYFMPRWRFDPLTQALVLRNCERLIRSASSVAAASEGMREWFLSAYQVDSTPLIHGYPRSEWLPPRPFHHDSPIRIAFAGSLYARREWNCLMRALAQAGGGVAGRDAVVDFIGHRPRRGVRWVPQAVCHGRKRPDEVPRLLNRDTIAYLPYWFSHRRSLAVRTAFPISCLRTWLQDSRFSIMAPNAPRPPSSSSGTR